jgi:hypothetical protein
VRFAKELPWNCVTKSRGTSVAKGVNLSRIARVAEKIS